MRTPLSRCLVSGTLILFAAALHGQVGTVNPATPMQRPQTPAPPKPAPQTGAGYSGLFDQSELGKEWKLLNPDANRWEMQPKRKSIMLITHKGGCPNLKDGKNQLMLDRDLPADDFELVVKVASHFEVSGSFLAVNLVKDESNYFLIELYSENYLGEHRHSIYFTKHFEGQDAGHFQSVVGAARDAYLRITREGSQYSGSYALIDPAKPVGADQLQWVNLGTMPWIRLQPKLLLCAANYQDAPEVSAEFFSVTLRPK
jgi:hypothetical protein